MENYIVINGKKAELTPEQLKALGIEVKKPSPFDRVPLYGQFYSIAADGVIGSFSESRGCGYGENAHRVSNYCTDKGLLQQQAYRETLNRLLWRFSMEHDGDKIDWDSDVTNKYLIFRTHYDGKWETDFNQSCQNTGVVYFYTRETAQQAIEEIVKPFMKDHPDFKL